MYVITVNGQTLTTLQEFSTEKNVDVKEFVTYHEARYFAENMGLQNYQITPKSGDTKEFING